MSRSPGFTLIEIIVVLAVVAILAGLVAPMAFRLIQGTQTTGAQDETQTLYRAIVGDRKQAFGYVGDVGTYPTSLVDLVRPPVDAGGNPVPGWKGPYLNVAPDPARRSQLVDPFGSPYEYFLTEQNRSLPDSLALISRGPDGTSTNTSATPNDSTTFTGTPPTDNTYLSQAGNRDNLTFPALDSANNAALLQLSTDGAFAPTILNFDPNSQVNAFVPACPGLFTLTLTSVPRGATDVRANRFAPGMAFALEQGTWTATLTSEATGQAVFSQTVVIPGGVTQAPALNVPGIDSSESTEFKLTVRNRYKRTIEVLEFNVKKKEIKKNKTATVNINACARVTIRDEKTEEVVDQFDMPFGAYAVIVGTTSEQLTVCDDTVKPFVKVFRGNLQIGMVKRKKCNAFTVRKEDTITITNSTGAVLQTFTMGGAATTVIL